MWLWNTLYFAGMALTFVGAVLLAIWGSSLQMRGGALYVHPKWAEVATKVQLPGFWMFAIGFLLQLFYAMHSLD